MHKFLLAILTASLPVLTASTALALLPQKQAANPQWPEIVRPIEGSVVLAGEGPLPDCVFDAFVHLCKKGHADIVIFAKTKQPELVKRWKQHGARSVLTVTKVPTTSGAIYDQLLDAEGLWFARDPAPLMKRPLFAKLVDSLRARGGVVGGSGVGTQGLLAGARVDIVQAIDPNMSAQESAPPAPDQAADVRLYLRIPPSTALIAHHGRQVCVLGNAAVDAHLPAVGGWPARDERLDFIDAFDPGNEPGRQLDLLSWLRGARDRRGPLFPPAKPPTPVVKQGTLILHGGSGVDTATFERFVTAAGGKDTPIVCIPSASSFDDGEEPRSYSARKLRELGCSDVRILHSADPEVADHSPRYLDSLRRAGGVWIDGGRTYRFIDALQYTQAHRLIIDVLNRDGVVGGSSAGCQVAGDFLMRGNPRTNKALVCDGYITGLALLRGVILDAHFLQRERGDDFEGLMAQHPQMLGIGVDEKTAILVRGSIAEVIGTNAVSFYDWRTKDDGTTPSPQVLKDGARYDLSKRKLLK